MSRSIAVKFRLALLGLVAAFSVLTALALIPVVSAQTTVDPEVSSGRKGLVVCGNEAGKPCTIEDVFNIFVIATNLLIGTVGLVTILAIVYSGFSMVIAAGNTEAITKAKKRLTNAITGLVLVLLAFILINLIIYGLLGAKGDKGSILADPLQYIISGGK